MLERWVRRRVVITWIASYVLISAIPLVGALMTYRITGNVVRRETSAANRYMLAALRRQGDVVFENAMRVFNDLAQSPNLPVALDSRPVKQRAYELLLLVREIRASMMATGSTVEDAFLLAGDPPLVISGRGHFSPEVYLDTYFRGSYGSEGLWLQMTQAGSDELERGSDTDPDLILMRKPLPLSGGSVRALFVAVVRLDALRSGPGGEPLAGVLSVVGRDGSTLWSSARPSAGLADTHTEAGGGRMAVTELPSAYPGARYVAVVDEALLQQGAVVVARSAVIASILSALACTAVVAFALRSNYRPLRRLLQWIENREPEAQSERSDEYARILHGIERVYHRVERTESALESQREALRQALTVQLLHGWVGEDAKERFRSLGFLFPHPRFAVLVLSLDHDPDVPASAATEARPLLQQVRRSRASDIEVVMAEVRGMAVCVLNAPAEAELGELELLGEMLRRELERAAGTDCDAGLSDLHDSLVLVFRAWTEAMEALEHGRGGAHGELAVYRAIERPERGAWHFPLEAEIRLTEAVKRGDAVSARRVADDVFRRSEGPGELAWVLALDVASAAVRAVGLAEDDAGSLRSLAASMERLRRDAPPAVLAEIVGAIVEQAAGEAALRRATEGNGKAAALVERIRGHLDRHHADASLNPDTVADAVGAHPVTAARLFRAATGMGMAEYLTHLRVERAKPLLRDGGRSIEEVARVVGFSSTKTMTRAFKRIEGVTPGRYRELRPAGGGAR